MKGEEFVTERQIGPFSVPSGIQTMGRQETDPETP